MKQNATPANAEQMEVLDRTPETQTTETQTTETNEADLTPEQKKAAAILRAKLPRLSEAGLNFERRTGNFFRASLVKEQAVSETGELLEKNGKPVYVRDANGNPVEKIRRLVVDLNHENEAETVESCADEIKAKRAAAYVVDGDKMYAKLEAEKNAAFKAYSDAMDALADFDAIRTAAIEIVNAFELPERTVTRIAVTAKLASAQDEIAKLRAMLIAAGYDPDTGKQ